MIQIRRYTSKPVEIDAIQLLADREVVDRILKWIGLNGGEATWYDSITYGRYLTITTLEGDMRASVGDYIIRGTKGEFYPCKPDIFEAKYGLS